MNNLNFKHTNITPDTKLQAYVEEKITALGKYHGEAERVEVEFEKVTHHKTGAVCRVEVNLNISGKLYRAEATESTFEAAIDIVKDELATELRKEHGKKTGMFRRGARKIKEMMRFGGN